MPAVLLPVRHVGDTIDNSTNDQAFVPYFFDRQGYYKENGVYLPTKRIPLDVNPCIGGYFNSTNKATVQQTAVCQAVAAKHYVTLATDAQPFQTEFSADWPDGVVPELETAPKLDPISRTKDQPCGVLSEQYEVHNGEPPKSHGRGMTQLGATAGRAAIAVRWASLSNPGACAGLAPSRS